MSRPIRTVAGGNAQQFLRGAARREQALDDSPCLPIERHRSAGPRIEGHHAHRRGLDQGFQVGPGAPLVLVRAGVGDGRRRLRGEQDEDLFVLAGELLSAFLVAEEEVADVRAPVAHRGSLQGLRRQQLGEQGGGDAERPDVGGHIPQSQRRRQVLEALEEPLPVGPDGQLPVLVGRDAGGDEVPDLPALVEGRDRSSPGNRCFRVLRRSLFKWPQGHFLCCRYHDAGEAEHHCRLGDRRSGRDPAPRGPCYAASLGPPGHEGGTVISHRSQGENPRHEDTSRHCRCTAHRRCHPAGASAQDAAGMTPATEALRAAGFELPTPADREERARRDRRVQRLWSAALIGAGGALGAVVGFSKKQVGHRRGVDRCRHRRHGARLRARRPAAGGAARDPGRRHRVHPGGRRARARLAARSGPGCPQAGAPEGAPCRSSQALVVWGTGIAEPHASPSCGRDGCGSGDRNLRRWQPTSDRPVTGVVLIRRGRRRGERKRRWRRSLVAALPSVAAGSGAMACAAGSDVAVGQCAGVCRRRGTGALFGEVTK